MILFFQQFISSKYLEIFRAGREYWEHLKPSSGRPMCASMSTPDQWGVVAGDDALKQNKGETTQEEITQLKQRQKQQQAK